MNASLVSGNLLSIVLAHPPPVVVRKRKRAFYHPPPRQHLQVLGRRQELVPIGLYSLSLIHSSAHASEPLLLGRASSDARRSPRSALEPCAPKLFAFVLSAVSVVQPQGLEPGELRICLAQQRLDPVPGHDAGRMYLGFGHQALRIYEQMVLCA